MSIYFSHSMCAKCLTLTTKALTRHSLWNTVRRVTLHRLSTSLEGGPAQEKKIQKKGKRG